MSTAILTKGEAKEVALAEIFRCIEPKILARAAGCHHKPIDSANRIRFKEGTKPPDKRGVYKGYIDIRYVDANGTKTWIPKHEPTTFFPDDWDKSRIRKEIREAYTTSTVDPDGRWQGRSSSGVKIEGFVDRTIQNNIISAWPIYEP